MEIYSHPDIPEILALPGNSSCCDCGMEKPKWASLNNGVFLCLKCAGFHRSLGVDISTIRSLQIDSWTDKQILYLTNGGNTKLKSIWEEYGIDSNTSVEKKYKSKACDYYRKYLKNLVEKISDPNFQQIELIKPNSEEGKQIVEIKKGNEDVNNMNIIGEFNQQKKDEGIFGVFGSFFNNVKKTATEVSGKISKGIEELKITDKLKEAGDQISDNAKIVGNYIKDKSQKVVNSDFVQGITKTAESGINVVIEKTKVLLNKNENRPENVNIVLLNNEQKQDEQNNIENQDIQMSNIISENNNINNINLNNNNEKNELGKGGEIKNEENKKEEIQNEEIPKEDKIDEKNEENNIDNGNNNNVIDNKKIEEENVKFEPEKQNGQ